MSWISLLQQIIHDTGKAPDFGGTPTDCRLLQAARDWQVCFSRGTWYSEGVPTDCNVHMLQFTTGPRRLGVDS